MDYQMWQSTSDNQDSDGNMSDRTESKWDGHSEILSSDDEPTVSFSHNGLGTQMNDHIYGLDLGDPDFARIQQELSKVSLIVITVERVANEILLDRYLYERDHVLQYRQKGFSLNEMDLYHGTKADKRIVCEEGLDQRLSRKGHFGRGIYFSDDPRKALNYSNSSDPDEPLTLLRCKVMLGDMKVYADGKSDQNLVREPLKDIPTNGWKYYDSVMGRPKDYREYVIYEGRRAIPEYVIQVQANSTKDWKAPVRDRSLPTKKPVTPSEDRVTPTKDWVTLTAPPNRAAFTTIRQTIDADFPANKSRLGAIKTVEQLDERVPLNEFLHHPEDFDLWNAEGDTNRILRAELTGLSHTDSFESIPALIAKPEAIKRRPTGDGTLRWRSCKVDGTTSTNEKGCKLVGSITQTASQRLAKLTLEFRDVTTVGDLDKAKRYILEANMDLDQAVLNFYKGL